MSKVSMQGSEGSSYVLWKANVFITDVPLLLSYYKSKLSLLLTISQTRPGAAQVMNAGFFAAVRTSGLFLADPDLGLGKSLVRLHQLSWLMSLEIENPQALDRYHEMLLFMVRVIASLVLSRGPQNARTIEQARLFLVENRPSMVAIFKRQARVGVSQSSIITVSEVIDELVDHYVLLISLTDFLEVWLSGQLFLRCKAN